MRRALPVLVFLLVVTACGSPDPARVPGPELLDGRAPEITAEVSVTPAGFDPTELALDASQAFELTNDADDELRVVGDLGTEPTFDTGTMRPGETTVIAFDGPGRYSFTIRDVEAPPLEVTVSLVPPAAD